MFNISHEDVKKNVHLWPPDYNMHGETEQGWIHQWTQQLLCTWSGVHHAANIKNIEKNKLRIMQNFKVGKIITLSAKLEQQVFTA